MNELSYFWLKVSIFVDQEQTPVGKSLEPRDIMRHIKFSSLRHYYSFAYVLIEFAIPMYQFCTSRRTPGQ